MVKGETDQISPVSPSDSFAEPMRGFAFQLQAALFDIGNPMP